jgi:hypothetical protein
VAAPGNIVPRLKRGGRPSYKSGLEKEFREILKDTGEEKAFRYEPIRMYIEYPSQLGFYMPDWVDEQRKIVIETKGIFSSADRKKTLLVRKWFPEWTHILVFERPNMKLAKKSKTSYKDWCDFNNIPCLGIKDLYNDETCLSTLIMKLKNGS